MTTLALSRTHSGSSNQTCEEKALSFEDSGKYKVEFPHSPSASKSSVFQVSGSRNRLAKAVQRLRNLMSAIQTMSCAGIYGSRSQGSNESPQASISYIQEKCEAQGSFSSRIDERVSSTDLLQNSAHIPAPSTNRAYKHSALFSEEALQFANAFLPSMEPLEIWGPSNTMEETAEPPSIRWIRRHTCIRPGDVVQIPSVTEKGAIYLLSCRNEPGWEHEVNLNAGNKQSQKLFISQADNPGKQPLGYSRAFIMCEPGSEP